MAHYDELGEFGLNELLAKRLTTPGGSVAPTVAPELFPVVTLESDRPEWGYLKGETLAAKNVSHGALAANYTMAQLYLPTNSRNIAVITHIQNNTGNLIVARLVGISGGLGGWTAVTRGARDTRRGGENTSLIVERNQNAAQPTAFPTLATIIGLRELSWPIVIGPGGAIGLYMTAVNTALDCNVAWYERPAQPGELV